MSGDVLDGMSVGVTEFDRDHRRIFDILDEIEQLLFFKKFPEARKSTEELLSAIRDHVARELRSICSLIACRKDKIYDCASGLRAFEPHFSFG